MKLREDFVTNSSSSSFIIALEHDLDPKVREVIDLILEAEGNDTCAARPLDDCERRDLAESNFVVNDEKQDVLIKYVDSNDEAMYKLINKLRNIIGVEVDGE